MSIITYRHIFIWIGVALVAVSLAIVATFGIRPGIDFTGGALTELRYTTMPEKGEVEGAIAEAGFAGAAVRETTTDAGQGYLITTKDLSDEERERLVSALATLGEGGELTRFTSVGPVIGAELADKAVWAIGAVLFLIVCYVAFAFAGVGVPVSSWVYGFMAILVLAHDIVVPLAAMSLLGYFVGVEADILFVTALLTILGYSVNDTIVIFDRIREKLTLHRIAHKKTVQIVGGMPREEITYTLTRPFSEVVGEAIVDTMARSINTSLTVLLALLALYFFGGEVTETFIFILMVGVVAGTYSSIFIASPLLVAYERWQAGRLGTTTKVK